MTAEPKAPCYGGKTQGDKTHYDIVLQQKKWEAKGLSKTECLITIGGAGSPYVTDIVVKMGRAVQQIEILATALRELDSHSAKIVLATGFQIRQFWQFYEQIIPQLRGGVEISRGTSEHAAVQFEQIVKLVDVFSKNYLPAKKGESLIPHPDKDELIVVRDTPVGLLIPIWRHEGISPETLGLKALTLAAATVDHPWLTESGSFRKYWKTFVKASDVLKEATEGLLITHRHHGWFHLEPHELDDWLVFECITWRCLRFRLNRMPPKPVQIKVPRKKKIFLVPPSPQLELAL